MEAFNGRLRAECLNQHWFLSLEDAKDKIASWRSHENDDRPHGWIKIGEERKPGIAPFLPGLG
jgi:putative transposase